MYKGGKKHKNKNKASRLFTCKLGKKKKDTLTDEQMEKLLSQFSLNDSKNKNVEILDYDVVRYY